jgi:hypothetical protein
VSKKRGSHPASSTTRAAPKNTISNYQRMAAERAAYIHPLDRVAAWIGRRSRLTRTIMCALIALVFTITMTILIYGTFFSLDPRRLQIGPLNVNNLPFFTFILLAIIGYTFYWAGWRVMIGFDMEASGSALADSGHSHVFIHGGCQHHRRGAGGTVRLY